MREPIVKLGQGDYERCFDYAPNWRGVAGFAAMLLFGLACWAAVWVWIVG